MLWRTLSVNFAPEKLTKSHVYKVEIHRLTATASPLSCSNFFGCAGTAKGQKKEKNRPNCGSGFTNKANAACGRTCGR